LVIVIGGGPYGLERIKRPTFCWRGGDRRRGSLALGGSVSLLSILLARVLRLASRLVTVVFNTGTIRFGDIE
jgi:hypothetical protein